MALAPAPTSPFTTDELVLPRTIRALAAAHPDRPYLRDVHGGGASLGEVHDASLAWARALMTAGVRPGEHVVSMLESGIEAAVTWFGIAWSGATEVPVNVDMIGGVLVHQLTTAAPRIVLAAPRAVAAVLAVADAVPTLETVVLIGDADEASTDPRVVDAAAFLATAPATPLRAYADLQPHDTASVMYTSGTTGPSKGVLMPWAQLHAAATLTADMIARGPVPEKVLYVSGPPNHVNAKGSLAAIPIVGGEVLLRHTFSTSQFWSDVAQHRVTDTSLVGAMADFLLGSPDSPADADTTLSNVLMAPVVPSVDVFNARFGTRTWSAYNMTEISVPTLLPDWVPGDEPSCGPLREGYPYYEARIVDAYDREVPDGEVGELIVRTGVPWTMNAGYLDMPEATATAWRNGWFHTGDAFRRDARGRFHFVDRLKDAIRRRGENVSSFEVEAEVLAHPGVAECAAIAVPSPETTEDEIKVAVVVADGAAFDPADLLAFLDGRMPRYMLPRYVQVVDALPRTPTLRVQKGQVPRTTAAADGVWERPQTPR